MVNQTSIKYISGLLENPASLTDGDQSSIALFRQTFPYFAPVRYLAALDHHRKEPMSTAILSGTLPYVGNWILFCDFLADGTPADGVESINTQSSIDIPDPVKTNELSTTIEEPIVLVEEPIILIEEEPVVEIENEPEAIIEAEPVVLINEPVAGVIDAVAPEENEKEEQNDQEDLASGNNSNQPGPEIRLSRKQRRQAAYLEQRRLALEQQQVKNVVTQEIKSPATPIKNLSDSITNNIPPIVDIKQSLTEQVDINIEAVKDELPSPALAETHVVSDLQFQLDQRAKEMGTLNIEIPVDTNQLPITNIGKEIEATKEEIETIDAQTPGQIIVVPAENWDEVKTNLIREQAANDIDEEVVTEPEVATIAEQPIEAAEEANKPLFAIRPGKISMHELKDELPAVKSEEPVGQSFQILPTKIQINEEEEPETPKEEEIVVTVENKAIEPEPTKEPERASTPIEQLLNEIENITPEQELLIRVITGKSKPDHVEAINNTPTPEPPAEPEVVTEVTEMVAPMVEELPIEQTPEPIIEIAPEPIAEPTIEIVPEAELVIAPAPEIKLHEVVTATHFPEDKQAPNASNEDDGLGTLIYPVYTEDYFLQQGVKISKEIPKDLTHAKDREKSLMVMMSFTEWLLHFKNTSDKQKEEKKDQKSLKTMWQKEKLAAAMEEENEEIPENVFEMAVNSITREDGLASESLADIYIKQKKYDQAIEMYRKLSLRNPKKYAYFARKIEEILKEKQS